MKNVSRKNKSNKVLGVLGGMGPMATVYFYNLLVEHTKAKKDSDHIDVVISGRATTPDRAAYIVNDTDSSPLDVLSKDLKSLIHYGANVIAIPCNTAHYFYDSLKLIDTDVHILDMIQESVNLLKSLGARSVGIMATRGTIRSRLYQKACRQSGITPHIPNDEIQKLITKMIYKHIKVVKDVDIEDFNKAVYYFERLKCEYITLGCTELSLLRKPLNLDDSYIDPLEVLVYKSIVECGKQPVGFSEAFEFMK